MIGKPKKKRVERTRNCNTWTESQYFSKIRSTLRNAFRYYKPGQKALELASRPSKSLNKRIKKEYICAECCRWYKRADVEIDHIQECGSLRVYEDIVPFLKRLTNEDVRAYQVLCKKCHSKKTQEFKSNKNE
jgi:ubiquinone/menaquinone biosynthesis C-methylase UbiE